MLFAAGIYTGITLMPVLPFISDNIKNIESIIKQAVEAGASYIFPWFGMTLRDRQRSYYYNKLDKLFPGLKSKYITNYGNKYNCEVPNTKELSSGFYELCSKYKIDTRIKFYKEEKPVQLKLFELK